MFVLFSYLRYYVCIRGLLTSIDLNEYNVLIAMAGGDKVTFLFVFLRNSPKYIVKLPVYGVPRHLRNQMENKQLDSVFEPYQNCENFTPTNYREKYSKLLHVEECQMELDIKRYSMDNAKLERDKLYLSLKVSDL